MFQGWEVNGCQQIYYIVLSTKEERNGDNRKGEKVDGQCKGEHGDKEIHFQQPDHHTKQNRVETPGSSLIVMLKNDGREKRWSR